MSDALWLSITLDPADKQPLYLQLYAAIKAMIEQGRLKPRDRLPASRAFAAELGISRSTVVGAIEQLTAEGYVTGLRGSGVRVSESIDELVRERPPCHPLPPLPAVQPARPAPALPDPRLFPTSAWRSAVLHAARLPDWNWIEEEDPLGSPRLRRAIAAYLSERRDLQPHPQDIIVTSGATGAINLALRAFMKPGEVIAIENPSHLGIHALAERHGLRIIPLPVDDEGARIEMLSRMHPRPRMLILTPSNQYPLGGALSAGRRQALLNWAERTDSLILEDDYDSEFRYIGKPLPPLAAGAASSRIIYVGSFSKVLSPGLSLGYLAVPPHLRKVVGERVGVSQRPSVPSQAPLATLMENGEFGRHLRRMRRAYAERRTALLQVLREISTDFLEPVDLAAGMHVVAKFGPALIHADDEELARLAVSCGIKARPLSMFYFAPPVEKGLLIGFSGSTPEEIQLFGERFRQSLEVRLKKMRTVARSADRAVAA